MLRRPPISIHLKLDDISEYEEMKQQNKDKTKSFSEPPSIQIGAKSKQEIFSRVGYVPPEQQAFRTPNFL